MELSALASSLQSTLGAHLPGILGAIAILVVGYVLAVVARAATRRLLGALKVNQRIEESAHQRMDVEAGIAIGVFWLVILITLVGVFNTLDLALVSNPFAEMIAKFLGYLPNLVAGTVLVIIVWVIATALRAIATKILSATALDEKLAAQAGMQPMSRNAGNVLFWLVILLFLPAILAAYELRGLLEPVQSMLNKLLDALPNVFAAVVIGFVGWLVATVLRGLVTNLLVAAGADKAAVNAGLHESVRLSRLVGTIVFIFVFVPTLIAALEALRIEALSRPATEMLARFLDAVPNLVAAALILTVTYYVARFASQLVARLLSSMGVDSLPERMGLKGVFTGAFKPSDLAAWLLLFFAMLFATVEAANRLEFTQVRDVVTMFIDFGGDVLLGGVILTVGFWLANVAYVAIVRASGEGTTGLAQVARIAILGLVIAMGLRAMGIADDIVNLGFLLTFGAVAVAVALSFGLGGREAAGRQMEHWLSKLRR
ncbi:MAG: mechanosensitive ion channel [Burkholderiales bacterium]|nr:mechanosensitive ion channel [Burkholderiales bacterium]